MAHAASKEKSISSALGWSAATHLRTVELIARPGRSARRLVDVVAARNPARRLGFGKAGCLERVRWSETRVEPEIIVSAPPMDYEMRPLTDKHLKEVLILNLRCFQ